MNKPPLIEYYNKRIFVNYKRNSFNNGDYHGWEFNFFAFGIDDEMFGRGEFRYDGHTLKGFTFLFLVFVYGYSYVFEDNIK